MPRRPGDPAPLPAATPDQIADVCYAAGFKGEGLVMAINVVLRESGGIPNNRNWNSNGTVDRGWFQFNSDAPPVPITAEEADSPTRAAAKAYQATKGGQNWGAWYSSAGSTGNYGKAKAAAAALVARGGAATAPIAGGPNSQLALGAYNPGSDVLSYVIDAAASVSQDIGLPPPGTMLSTAYVEPIALANIVVEGDNFTTTGLAERVSGGHMEMSVAAVSQLTLSLADPDRLLGRKDLLRTGAQLYWRRGAAVPVSIGNDKPKDLPWDGQIAAHEIEADDPLVWKVTSRATGAQLLRHPTPGVLAVSTAKDQSLTEYAAGLAAAVGLGFTGQGLPRLSDIAPVTEKAGGDKGQNETPWDVLQRLASDEGVWLWEAAGHLYVGHPTWLIDALVTVPVTVETGAVTDCVGLPKPRTSMDSPELGTTMDIELPRWRGELCRPGMTVAVKWPDWLKNYPDEFLIHAVSWAVDGGIEPVKLSCVEAIDPHPRKPADDTLNATAADAGGSNINLGTAGDPISPNASQLAQVAIAFALRQLGKPYVWGGNGPDVYDCTGLINASWAAAGKNINSRPTPTIGAHAVPLSDIQPGDIVSFPGNTHSALAIGNGEMVEAPKRGTPVRRVPLRLPIATVERVD